MSDPRGKQGECKRCGRVRRLTWASLCADCARYVAVARAEVRAVTAPRTQAVKDALADAETFWSFVWASDAPSVYWLGFFGAGASWIAGTGKPWSPYSDPDAGVWAKSAARAAFQAVPALRGEA